MGQEYIPLLFILIYIIYIILIIYIKRKLSRKVFGIIKCYNAFKWINLETVIITYVSLHSFSTKFEIIIKFGKSAWRIKWIEELLYKL